VLVAGDPGLPKTLSGPSHRIAPRFNAAYDVRGDGKTAVRGSIGLYYGRDVLAIYQTNFLNRPPFTGASVVARNGRLSNPWLTSQNPTYTRVPFPFTDQDPQAFSWPGQVSGLVGLDPDYGLASSWQWNVAVEREVLRGIRLELGYQGNSSTDTPTLVPTNLAVFAAGANDSAGSIQSRRPNQFAGDNVRFLTNDGISKYDQVLLISRMRRAGFMGQASWAWTHARRNFGGSQQQTNRDWDSQVEQPAAPDLLRDNQNNHTLAGFFVYDLPFLEGSDTTAGKLLGGWSVSGNGYWSFRNKGESVFTGYDTNADGYGNDLAAVSGPISYPKTKLEGQGDLLYQWFDPAPFRYPGGGTARLFTPTVAYDGLNVLSQLPSRWGFDAAVMKNFRLRPDAKLQLRFEVYNLFNHANLNTPITNLTDPNLGKIRGKSGDGRRVQLGARFVF
jgi:hypothetical protein